MKKSDRLRAGIFGLLSAVLAAAGGCRTNQVEAPPVTMQQISPNHFAEVWSRDIGLGGATADHIFLFDNLIIVYASDNTAHVVERESGRLKFINSLPKQSGTVHPPSVFNDRIVYPATTSIKIVSAKYNTMVADITVPYAIRTGGTGAGSNYYVGADFSNGGRVVAIDMNNPSHPPRWELMTIAAVRAAPLIYKGTLYFGSEDGQVWAITEDKVSVWNVPKSPLGTFHTSKQIVCNLAVDNDAVYAASTDTKLYALNRTSGMIKWQYLAGAQLHDAPLVTNDMVYLHTPGDGLIALAKTDSDYWRKPRWTSPAAKQLLAQDDKNSYVLLRDGHLAALDKMTGEQKFGSKRDDFMQIATNEKDGLIYAIDGSKLVCIKPVLKQGVIGDLVDAKPVKIDTVVASR